jgi:glycosyltransferase involved in cell wall biosynthesis
MCIKENMSAPLVCICIPVYNCDNTISETLDSLVVQTYENLIIKIFDNKSSDKTIDVVGEYQKKYNNIFLIKHSKHVNGSYSFDRCIEGMQGDYGAIFHADDIYHPSIVEEQVKFLSNGEVSAVSVAADLINNESKNIGTTNFPRELLNEKYHKFNFNQLFTLILKYDNFLMTPSVMSSVDLFKNNINALDKKFNKAADLDMWLRFSLKGSVGLISKRLMSYRESENSFSFNEKYTRIESRDMLKVLKFYLNIYNDLNFNMNHFKYLSFKDTVIISSNKVLLKQKVDHKDIDIFDIGIIKQCLTSTRKLKVYFYALIVKTMLFFKIELYLKKVIEVVNKISYKNRM